MTPIVPVQSAAIAEESAVSLARYAAIIRQPECSLWGVANSDEITYECSGIWTLAQRLNVARYLAEAQEEIETEVGYFLSPRFVVGSLADQPNLLDKYVDDQCFGSPISARWPKIIAPGIRGETTIAAGAAVSHAVDPAVVGPVATAVTDPDEITIYHPGTDVEINPSGISIVGGAVTITIPRCRMVKSELADNPDAGIDYSITANFESTVDVVRVYVDGSTNAELVSPHACGTLCAGGGCTEHTTAGCIYVIDPRNGILRIAQATYSDGVWADSGGACCRSLTRVRLNYRAGMAQLTRQAEDVIVRLAHSKMPAAPCGCSVSQFMWTRDRNTPEFLSRERLNCPFGMNDGAWIAWRFAQTMKQWRGSTL